MQGGFGAAGMRGLAGGFLLEASASSGHPMLGAGDELATGDDIKARSRIIFSHGYLELTRMGGRIRVSVYIYIPQ